MRASDADRHQLVAALEQHTAAGRLSLEEYSQRVDQVLQARTLGELAELLHDLPDGDAPDDDAPAGSPAAGQLAIAFLLALLALVVIGIAVAAFR